MNKKQLKQLLIILVITSLILGLGFGFILGKIL